MSSEHDPTMDPITGLGYSPKPYSYLDDNLASEIYQHMPVYLHKKLDAVQEKKVANIQERQEVLDYELKNLIIKLLNVFRAHKHGENSEKSYNKYIPVTEDVLTNDPASVINLPPSMCEKFPELNETTATVEEKTRLGKLKDTISESIFGKTDTPVDARGDGIAEQCRAQLNEAWEILEDFEAFYYDPKMDTRSGSARQRDISHEFSLKKLPKELRVLLEKDTLSKEEVERGLSALEERQKDIKDEHTKIAAKIQEMIFLYTFMSESLRKMQEGHCRLLERVAEKTGK